MRITVNGNARDYPAPVTIEGLLIDLELSAQPCAVEVNREVVPRRRHAEHALGDGDAIEIVTLVGGG